MAELLEQPALRAEVEGMGPELLDWYKQLLVECGVYQDFIRRRESTPRDREG